jgi:hypothetical protein
MVVRWEPIRRRRRPRRGSTRNPAYLEYIRSLPCLVCVQESEPQKTRTEAAHVGKRGLGQKCSDYETLPLCGEHHRYGVSAIHVLGRFWEAYHQISVESEIERLRQGF